MEEECRMMSPPRLSRSDHHCHGHGDDGMDFDSPAAKRQRHMHTAPAAVGLGSGISASVSPEAQHHRLAPPLVAAAEAVPTVSMERDDQYALEWWKSPPAAPPLLPATTMSSNSNSNSHSSVVGCYACQRLFVPPTTASAAVSVASTAPSNTLLNYFSSTKKKTPAAGAAAALPQPSQHSHASSPCQCTFCERTTCHTCLRACEQCQLPFCILCSTQTYVQGGNDHAQQTLCLDCASVKTAPAADMGDAMMEG